MFTVWSVLLIILGYLLALFFVAHLAERREREGRSIVSNPYVYSLSLAVYCTSWTFYGSVGKAANSGLSFLTIYLGPTLMAMLWWVVLRKMVYIAKRNRITTLSDFIAFRYGKSLMLSVLVTVVAVVGIAPYLGLQMKAIMTTISRLVGQEQGSAVAGWMVALMIGGFAVMFGARRLDASERHGGLIFAVAFESAIKLVAFMAVGLFTTYWCYDGFGDIFGRVVNSEYAYLLGMGEGTGVSYLEWASLTFLSMMAIMFLPRQFHVAVVENSDVEHIKKAMWLFPLYLFLINIFVLPIAYGGLMMGRPQSEADYFVLTIPLSTGYPALAVLAFIGGFSAATAMMIVSSLALSTMVMNSLVVPMILRFREEDRGLPAVMLNIKRVLIIGAVFLGYMFAVSVGEFYTLVDMGLKSFEAVSILAPSVLLGMYWKGGNVKGAAAGIIAGFAVWTYTLLVPALMKAGLIYEGHYLQMLFTSELLNPHALFGLKGLDRWSHSLFWGMLFNITLFAGVSFMTRQSDEDVKQAILCVDSFDPAQIESIWRPASVDEIERLLETYIGRGDAHDVVEGFLLKNRLARDRISGEWLMRLRDEAEIVLSGALGPSISTLVFESRSVLTPEEKARISESIQNISRGLRRSRQELAEAYHRLEMLQEFSESIIESLPLGVATLNESLEVTYWNRAMEGITGIEKGDAMNMPADMMLQCLEPNIFGPAMTMGEITCERKEGRGIVLKGYLSKLSGQQRGYVLVFEDITEKRKIEAELFRTSKHASIGRLAAGVSHEIGNPLASISSIVQELLAEDISEFERESLGTVNQQVERIARIVRNLGDFARVSPRTKQPTDLGNILANTLDLVRYDKHFKRIVINSRVDRDVPTLRLDPDQMQQVFLNLMLNAKDAMPEGGALDIAIERHGPVVAASFCDTGEGIAPDRMDKVFDPFFTTKGTSKGTGLGLSICYSIIKDHGGEIKVRSRQGEGAVFTITLPVGDIQVEGAKH